MPKKFVKGYDERRNLKGAPRKLTTTLTQLGYTQREAKNTILAILALTEDEVQAVADDDSGTILERTIAAAVLDDMKKGKLNNLETLLNRAAGKPSEQLQMRQATEVTFKH